MQLTGLRGPATAATVMSMISYLNFQVPEDNIRLQGTQFAQNTASDTSPSFSAKVLIENRDFGKKFCERLKRHKRSLLKLDTGTDADPWLHANAIHIANEFPTIPTSSTGTRVDFKKVHLSWHRPVRQARLHFHDKDIAAEVCEGFAIGHFKVIGYVTRAVLRQKAQGQKRTQDETSDDSLSDTLSCPLIWVVTLEEIPGKSVRHDILKDMPECLHPFRVALGKPSFDPDMDVMNVIVKSLLLEFGPLHYWADAPEVGFGRISSRRAKAQARFTYEEDARKATKKLNDTLLSFSSGGKLTIQLVCTARLREKERICRAAMPAIEEAISRWRDEFHVAFVAYPATHGYSVLRLEGENADFVARVKKELVSLLKGSIVEIHGKPLWAPSLATSGPVVNKLHTLETDNGVTVVRDIRTKCLRLYGPSENQERAVKELEEIIYKANLIPERTLYLDDRQLDWAYMGGFRAIAQAISPQATIAFDPISTPPSIVITGTEDDYAVALHLATEFFKIEQDEIWSTFAHEKFEEKEPDCSICWKEAELPISTKCGHVYCTDCFEQLCSSGGLVRGPFHIRCEGDTGRCQNILPLAELQFHLSSSILEEVLNTAFKDYVGRHPDLVRYCPGADCDQVYRVTHWSPTESEKNGKEEYDHYFRCPSCMTRVCTSCHTPGAHPGFNCAEHKEDVIGGHELLMRAKAELGVKDCPDCLTSIEKTDGCDHVQCVSCKVHICWRCLKLFRTSKACYNHLNNVHGGVFVDMV